MIRSDFKLPKGLAKQHKGQFFNASDTRRPAIELQNGNWLLLAKAGPVEISDSDIVFVGHWHEIQHALWEAQSRTLIIRLVDPTREPWRHETVAHDVRDFMSQFDEFIEYTIVATASRETPRKVLIQSAIRRTHDGNLFSTLTARAGLLQDEQELADELEKKLRESVGLEG